LGDGRETRGNWKRFRGGIVTEVGVIIRELLDVIFDEAVNVPFEHWAGYVKPEFLDDILINLFGVRRAAHAFDTKEFEVAFLKVVKAVARDSIADVSELWHKTGG
jgi:hypothetical protein